MVLESLRGTQENRSFSSDFIEWAILQSTYTSLSVGHNELGTVTLTSVD